MNIVECIKVALRSVRGNKLRAGLTMLGVIIGVGAVIIVVSLGEGTQSQITGQIESLGSNLLIVSPGRMGGVGGMQGSRGAFGSLDILTLDDVQAIKEQSPAVGKAVPEVSRNISLAFGDSSIRTNVIGTTPEYLEVRNYKLASGTMFTSYDLTRKGLVVVLGKNIANELFKDDDPLGRRIKVGRLRFTIIGVLEPKGEGGLFSSDDIILVPISTAQKKLLGTRFVRTIYVQALDSKSLDAASQQVNWVMQERHPESNSFQVTSQESVLSVVQTTTRILTLFLAGIASVSLIVGGIGITNVMLVSVTERTREIGIRRAIGARQREILFQFLIESVVLSLCGGFIGVVAGVGGSRLFSILGGFNTAVSWSSIVLAWAFSIAVGLFFGIYPATRAAGLNPIEALRYE